MTEFQQTDTRASETRPYDFRMLPLAIIDPPDVAMRRGMDDQKLEELARSIEADGLRQPIGVVPRGDRFVVSYGHRRRIACEMAGETMIPCFVLADDSDAIERFKVAENWLREETNPAEEAIYFQHLLDHQYAGDIVRMCRALGVKESRVNGRLDLLRLGFEDVFEALQARQISLAVAKELNKIKAEKFRRLVLGDAIAEGSTAAAVATRRMNIERMLSMGESGENVDSIVAPSGEAPLQSVDRCLLCDSAKDQNEMIYVKVHRSCQQVAERSKDA